MSRAVIRGPMVIPMQPTPRKVLVAHLDRGPCRTTAVARFWRDGDSGRCRLCPRCSAQDEQCLIVFPKHVPAELAAMVNTR